MTRSLTRKADRPVDTAGPVDAPLAGLRATRTGASLAARVAQDHLVRLGAEPVPAAEADDRAPAEVRLVPAAATDLPADGAGTRVTWGHDEAPDLVDEVTVQAACGLMAVHGLADGGPRRIGVDYASVTAGLLTAQATLASALATLRGGPQRRARTTVADAALLAAGQYLAAASAADPDDVPPEPPGRRPPFVSADGVRFEVETLDAEPWQRFWTAAGAPADDVRRGWRPFLLRYATARCPLPLSLHETAGRHPYAVVAEIARRSGVSLCAVRSGDPAGGAQPPCALTPGSGCDPAPRHPGAGGPLAGLTVVEATRRIQGPLAAHLLRLLGARVIRIEQPMGDPLRGLPPMDGDCSARFRALNRGKEVVEADIKDPAGRRAILGLVRDADVFLHNWAPGRAERLGLDEAAFGAVNPGLVYATASAWGDAAGTGDLLGTDFVVQAHSGLGGVLFADGGPARPSLMTLLDVLGGVLSAQGVLAALVARERRFRGYAVHTSLLAAAQVLRQAAEPPPDARRDPWGRPLPAADGHVAVDGRAAGAVAAVLGVPPDAAPGRVARQSRTWDAADLVDALAAAGVAAATVTEDLTLLATDPRFAAVTRSGGACYLEPPWRFS